VAHDAGNIAVSVENMLDAGRTKITDLLSITSLAIPQGAHAIITRERVVGVDGLVLAEAISARGRQRGHHPGARGVHPDVFDWADTWADRLSRDRMPNISGCRDRLEIRSGEGILEFPGDLS
jgi:hypothetical protein